jgi:hypothetical protein
MKSPFDKPFGGICSPFGPQRGPIDFTLTLVSQGSWANPLIPEFTLSNNPTLLVDDVARLILDTDINFGSPANYDDTLTQGDIDALIFEWNTGELSGGTYYARVEIRRGGSAIAVTNDVGPFTIAGTGGNSLPFMFA